MSKNKEKKANVKGLRSLLYNNKFVLLLSEAFLQLAVFAE